MIPHRTPFFLPMLYPSLHWRLATGSKELFLTFDDGPVPGPTEFVIDTLDHFSLKATFFCIGNNVNRYPEVFRRLLKAGHRVGNHTHNHLSGWRLRTNDYLEEILRCDAALNSVGEHPGLSALFRPPYGRITRRQIATLNGRPVIMWDVLSADYDRHQSPASCLRNTLRAIRPGSIIVFHDSYKAEKSLSYALPRMIDECLNRGYTFTTIRL
jgi:peptidoglycan/xylan/chitin deacetylase (PgdA/CDA1 family)